MLGKVFRYNSHLKVFFLPQTKCCENVKINVIKLKVIHNKYFPGGFEVFYLNPIFAHLRGLFLIFFGV